MLFPETWPFLRGGGLMGFNLPPPPICCIFHFVLHSIRIDDLEKKPRKLDNKTPKITPMCTYELKRCTPRASYIFFNQLSPQSPPMHSNIDRCSWCISFFNPKKLVYLQFLMYTPPPNQVSFSFVLVKWKDRNFTINVCT